MIDLCVVWKYDNSKKNFVVISFKEIIYFNIDWLALWEIFVSHGMIDINFRTLDIKTQLLIPIMSWELVVWRP